MSTTLLFLAACTSGAEETEVTQVTEAPPATTSIPATAVTQEEEEEDMKDAEETDISVEAVSTATSLPDATPAADSADSPLPQRAGEPTTTTGTVPHVQIDVVPVQAVNDELFRRAYLLPGVEDRPTIVSLPGARGMWLTDEITVVHPQAIVNGREFAHIHPDGSLHAPLPYERALEVAEKGWGERHPWADERDGWEGFVMLYTPQSAEELEITFQLIVESYNYVTGQSLEASDFN